MKEGLIKDTYELIFKEIQTVITIFYILIVGIGMLFTYQKYSEFGINIFDYADVFDFLVAPFSDFKILLFSTITITLVFLFFKLDSLFNRKFPKNYSRINFGWDKKSWFNSYRYSLFFILFIFYLYLSADFYGKFTSKQTKENSPINLKYSDNENINGIVIGKTKDVIFLLQGKKVKAIPINSIIKEFEIK
ncbi:hypothetical protein [Polaribacter sp. AHE13PA]|uniref:hypothetical protein n=1 Tax=Polaribacter sp. AHE13PA TaxID=2745562 RepID=UPI0020C7AB55|nr:hypothetical protein [Polaribacter sp. AHE13PA]